MAKRRDLDAGSSTHRAPKMYLRRHGDRPIWPAETLSSLLPQLPATAPIPPLSNSCLGPSSEAVTDCAEHVGCVRGAATAGESGWGEVEVEVAFDPREHRTEVAFDAYAHHGIG